ncbi:MAG: T9SS type B sorting domain-containing protein [Bacteroidota bacterium]
MLKFISSVFIIWLAVSLVEVVSSPSYFLDSHCNIQVPDAFSPNGDGINDEFYISSICHLSDFSLKIYSQKEELLFVIPSSSKSWDGKIAGRLAPEGKYKWKMVYHTGPGERVVKRGQLLLIR